MKLPENIRLIFHGFALALIGATSIALYILGFSQLYTGGAVAGPIELLASAVMFIVFYAGVLPYLDRLADWFDPEK